MSTEVRAGLVSGRVSAAPFIWPASCPSPMHLGVRGPIAGPEPNEFIISASVTAPAW